MLSQPKNELNVDMLNALIDMGADTTIKNTEGLTPAELVVKEQLVLPGLKL